MIFTSEELRLHRKLDKDTTIILGALAYSNYFLSSYNIKRLAKSLLVREISVNEIRDFLDMEERWYEPHYCIKVKYILPISFQILTYYPTYIEKFQKIYGQGISGRLYWKIVSTIFPSNVYHSSIDNISHYDYLWGSDVLFEVFDYYFYNTKAWPGFELLSPNKFLDLIEKKINHECLDNYNDFNCQGIIDVISFYEQKKGLLLTTLKDEVRAVQFTLDAKTPKFQAGPNEWTLCIDAIRNLYIGDTQKAYSLFQSSLRMYNKTRKEKNFYSCPIFTFYLSLCYAKSDNSDARKKAGMLLNKFAISQTPEFWPSYVVNKYICLNEKFDDYDYIPSLSYNEYHDLYFQYNLIKYFFKLTKGISPQIEKLQPKGLLIRHELSSYVESCKDPVAAALLEGKPILSSLKMKEEWERIIEEMSDLIPKNSGKSDSQSSIPENRIIYVVNDNGKFDIREQKRKKNGELTSGTHMTFSSLVSGKLNYLDKKDNIIILEQSGYNPRGLILTEMDVIPHMIGTDKVYYDNLKENKLEQVNIHEEKAYFSVDKNKNGNLIFRHNLPYNDIRKVEIKKNSNTDYSVFKLTDIEYKILNKVARINSLPAASEKMLVSFFEQLNGIVEVHSPLIKGGSSLEKIKGDSRVYLQFKPSGQATYILNIIVRPLSEGKLELIPGEGKDIIYDSVETKRYQIERNLKTEKENYELLMYFMYGLSDSEETDTGKWSLSPKDMLETINFARENSKIIVVEWPKGQSVKIKTKLTSSMVSASIKHKESWFEMEGQVKLDHDSTINLQKLLTLFNENRTGKFIQLSEDEFIVLEESLKDQLQKLSDISTSSNKRIPIFQVGAIAELAKGDDSLITTDKKFKDLEKRMTEASKLDPDIPSYLQADLRDYQIDGFKWMVRLSSWGAGACLADDMGLGKTIQAISLMLYRKGPSLVVAPASVVLNWVSEIERFAPVLNTIVLNESDSRIDDIESATVGDVVLCSYGILQREEDTIAKKHWDLVCLDEAHSIKNHGTKTSAAAMRINADARLALTGTPIQNNLSELWNIFQFLNPGLLGSYESFTKRFNTSIDSKGKMRRLKAMIQPFMLRRRKSDVIEELPEKTEVKRMIELSKAETIAYEAIRESTEKALMSSNKVDVSILAQITKLRQAACSMKLVEKIWPADSSKEEYSIELLSEIIDGGNRVLVFSQFTSFLTIVKDKFIKETDGKIPYLYLDGSVPIRKREEMVNKFQKGEAQVFFISLKAGGLGLNLTGANYVIHLDPWWNPAIEAQATDRAHRIGQKQNVTVYHLLSSHTIEEKILRLHKTKKDIADFLMEGTNVTSSLTLEELRNLVNAD